MRLAMALAAVLALAAPAGAQGQDAPLDLMEMFGVGGLKGEALAKAVAEAGKHPLGSPKNPVRASGPKGQRAYLARLRCEDGEAPTFKRGGSTAFQPFGNIVDVYAVRCRGVEPASVYLDMYHSTVESRPVPGFTVASD